MLPPMDAVSPVKVMKSHVLFTWCTLIPMHRYADGIAVPRYMLATGAKEIVVDYLPMSCGKHIYGKSGNLAIKWRDRYGI